MRHRTEAPFMGVARDFNFAFGKPLGLEIERPGVSRSGSNVVSARTSRIAKSISPNGIVFDVGPVLPWDYIEGRKKPPFIVDPYFENGRFLCFIARPDLRALSTRRR